MQSRFEYEIYSSLILITFIGVQLSNSATLPSNYLQCVFKILSCSSNVSLRCPRTS